MSLQFSLLSSFILALNMFTFIVLSSKLILVDLVIFISFAEETKISRYINIKIYMRCSKLNLKEYFVAVLFVPIELSVTKEKYK